VTAHVQEAAERREFHRQSEFAVEVYRESARVLDETFAIRHVRSVR
jgi:hypothetical protein